MDLSVGFGIEIFLMWQRLFSLTDILALFLTFLRGMSAKEDFKRAIAFFSHQPCQGDWQVAPT